MIALDTNILVYARREETAQHARANSLFKELAEGDQRGRCLGHAFMNSSES